MLPSTGMFSMIRSLSTCSTRSWDGSIGWPSGSCRLKVRPGTTLSLLLPGLSGSCSTPPSPVRWMFSLAAMILSSVLWSDEGRAGRLRHGRLAPVHEVPRGRIHGPVSSSVMQTDASMRHRAQSGGRIRPFVKKRCIETGHCGMHKPHFLCASRDGLLRVRTCGQDHGLL